MMERLTCSGDDTDGRDKWVLQDG